MANQYTYSSQQPYMQDPSTMDQISTIGGGAAQGAGAGMAFGPYGAAIGGAIGAGYGIYQLADAAKKRKELQNLDRTRPVYQVPGQIGENTAMYRNMAQNTRLPGQNIAENNIYQGQANVNNAIVGTGRNAGQIMASLQGANQNTSNSLNQLAVRGAELNQQNKDKYARAMQNQADYGEKAWDMNTFQPYQQRVDEYNRGMAMNRQQQQQGVQTLMNAGTILGSVYGQSRANRGSRMSQTPSNEYANADISQEGLGGGMSTPSDNQNPYQYGFQIDPNQMAKPIINNPNNSQQIQLNNNNSSWFNPGNNYSLTNANSPKPIMSSFPASNPYNPNNGQYTPYGQGYNFKGNNNSYFKPY